jgi:hypothetical protein
MMICVLISVDMMKTIGMDFDNDLCSVEDFDLSPNEDAERWVFLPYTQESDLSSLLNTSPVRPVSPSI